LERLAYRQFELLPAQFYELTPREFHNMLKGKEDRINDELHLMAVGAIMQRKANNKKNLKFTDLVGEKEKRTSTRSDPETKKREMERLSVQLGTPTRRKG
jgi:hypothetical protein